MSYGSQEKNDKCSKNKKETIEKELETIEKNLDKIEKINEKKKKEEEKEQKRLKKREQNIKKKTVKMKKDLENQLSSQNKNGKQFDDMIEDYIYLVRLKEDLLYDIEKRGIRYEIMTGNGFIKEVPNESCERLLKVNGQMLKILQDLELKAPEESSGGESDLL